MTQLDEKRPSRITPNSVSDSAGLRSQGLGEHSESVKQIMSIFYAIHLHSEGLRYVLRDAGERGDFRLGVDRVVRFLTTRNTGSCSTLDVRLRPFRDGRLQTQGHLCASVGRRVAPSKLVADDPLFGSALSGKTSHN